MMTRLTAATKKQEAAAALGALHAAEAVGSSESASAPAPNAKVQPNADAEADVESEADAESEPEPDAEAMAAGAFDATVSTRFQVQGRDVVRSHVRLPGIHGFVHYKKLGVLFQGVQIADSSSMPKGQVCGVLVRDDLEEGFIIVRPSMEGGIYLQLLDLLMVQKGEGLVDVHGAIVFSTEKIRKKHQAVVNEGWAMRPEARQTLVKNL
jgi:hypothetical protein